MQSVILVASCLLAVASAWNCPVLPVVENLNATALAGTWYQQSSAGAAVFGQPGASCAASNYQVDTTGNNLLNMVSTEKVLFKYVETDGYLNYKDRDTPDGKLTLTVHSLFFDTSVDVWILDTDYDNYLIYFACKKVFGIPAESSWILTRLQNPTGDDKSNLDTLIRNAFVNITKNGGPDLNDFVPMDQDSC